MLIRNFSHKGLRRLYDDDQTKGVPAASANKLRKMLFFLDGMKPEGELRDVPLWNAHELKGNRKGTWSLSVTANRRLTFSIQNDEICNLDLEDYH